MYRKSEERGARKVGLGRRERECEEGKVE